MEKTEGGLRESVPAPPAEQIFAGYEGLDYPYLKLVPKDPIGNRKFRKALLEKAANDKSLQDALFQKCKEDILFWVNAFCWLLEPRTPAILPFITYPYQDRVFLKIQESIGRTDLVMVKSRDMGGTWLVMTAFAHQWQFFPNSEFQLTSRVEESVDTDGDYSTLLPKVDFLLENQPKWLAPGNDVCNRKHLNLRNTSTKSLLKGYATSAGAARGARRRGTLFDEFAIVDPATARATLAVSQHVGTRIWCSTPYGPSGAFADVAYDPHIPRIDLDWSEHPQKNPGLYTSENGKLKILDPNADFEMVGFRVADYEADGGTVKPWPQAQRGFPPDYHFVLDGKRRSPYYDYECRRTPIQQWIAQELDRDFLRSGAQFFDEDVLARARKKCRVPEFIGHFNHNKTTGELFRDNYNKVVNPLNDAPDGLLRLWSNLREPYVDPSDPSVIDLEIPARDITGGDIPVDADYVLGVDVSAGSGQSCSAVIIIDTHTAEQIGEYADPHIPTHELAPLVKAMAIWLNNALVIWDGQGSTGAAFRRAFLELNYPNYWRRRAEDRTTKREMRDYPGWIGNKGEKASALSKVRQSWADGKLRTYSERILNEASQYIWTMGGGVEHSAAENSKDPTGAKAAHGDRVMALAMAWHASPEPGARKEINSDVAKPGSLAYRRVLAKKAEKANARRHRRPRRVSYA